MSSKYPQNEVHTKFKLGKIFGNICTKIDILIMSRHSIVYPTL